MLYSGAIVFNQVLRPEAAHAVAAVLRARVRLSRQAPAVLSGPTRIVVGAPLIQTRSVGLQSTLPPASSLLLPETPLMPSVETPALTVETPRDAGAETVLRAGAKELSQSGGSPESARKIYEGPIMAEKSLGVAVEGVADYDSESSQFLKRGWGPAAFAGGLTVAVPALAQAAQTRTDLGWKASLAVAGAAALGALYVRMKGARSLGKALSERDAPLTDQLLSALDVMREAVEAEGREVVESMAEAVLVGNYAAARGLLSRLAELPIDSENQENAKSAVALLSSRIPHNDLKGSGLLRGVMTEVLASIDADPFSLQDRISLLVKGINPTNMPRPLWDRHLKLSKKASLLARARAAARRGLKIGDVQLLNDCFVRALYDLPLKALDPLRRNLSYKDFLARVEKEFPGKDVMEKGLEFDDFKVLLERMGMSYKAHTVSEFDIAALVSRHGAVMAGVSWFDTDASEMESMVALRHWRRHAVIITRVEGSKAKPEFVVRDSLLSHESRYTSSELALLMPVIYTLEPDDRAGGKLEKFLSR